MASPPRRPIKRKTDASQDAIAGRAIVARPSDLRQPGLFDQSLPKWIRPCLPTLVDKPPVGPQWVHEIKWDGYRISVYLADGKVTIRTRGGHDWTPRFPAIAAAAERLAARSLVMDGEAVILDDRGRSSFAELQADLDRRGSRRAVLYAFDLLFLDGEDLRKAPLEERRHALGRLIPRRSAILLSEDFAGRGEDLFRIACEDELEGIVSKRLDRPYRSGRSRDWLKTKCVQTGDFVITGYQPGSGAIRAPLANIRSPPSMASGCAMPAPSAPASARWLPQHFARDWRESRPGAAQSEGRRRHVGVAGSTRPSRLSRRDDGRRIAARQLQGADGLIPGRGTAALARTSQSAAHEEPTSTLRWGCDRRRFIW